MADIIRTDFEDYAVEPEGPDYGQSLLDHGWDNGGGINALGVVSGVAHSGSKSVKGHGSFLQLTMGYQGRSLTVEMWARTLSAPAPFNQGPGLQFASLLGTAGVSQWPISFINYPPGSTDMVLVLFDAVVATVAGVIIPDTFQHYKMVVRFSTVNADGDDVNADGYVRCYVDDVLVIEQAAARVACTSVEWASNLNRYDLTYNGADGYFDDIALYDDVPDETIPPDDSNPCCGDGGDPDPTETSSGHIPPSLQPWDRLCAGGGVVPQADDVVDAAVWDL